MTSRRSYQSDEEVITQLRVILESPAARSADMDDPRMLQARPLAEELAERIYNDPEKWGYAHIPDKFREDAVIEAFTALLFAVPDMDRSMSVVDWFTKTVEARFRRLWALGEKQAVEREEDQKAALSSPVPGESAPAAPTLFTDTNGVWPDFEREFPRDAFALRLRYMEKKDPQEMVVMLDAPSERAINMRLDRARDRFRMYCEQQGLKRRDSAKLMQQLSEEK